MKARITEAPTDQADRIPPMPGSPEDLKESGGLSSPSTISDGEPQRTDAVSEEFAGEIYKIPFQIWHGINPHVPPEPEPRIVTAVSPSLARVLEKYGVGKIAKDEVLVAFYIAQTTFSYVKAARDYKKFQTLEGKVKEESVA